MSFWWHPRSAKVGEAGPDMPPVEECVLSTDRASLERERDRFETLCRNGWYGPEWQELARGRGSWVTPCP